MKIRPEQLSGLLQSALPPLLLISGDEPLLVQEAVDSVRLAAKAQQFAERCVFDINDKFDWGRLAEQSQSLSLFSSRILVECHLPTGKPGIAGANAFAQWQADPPPDHCLMIIASKVDAAAKWVKNIEKNGIFLPIWPVKAEQMPQWIRQRALQKKIKIDAAGITLLCEQVTGNCLAAKQELDKLALLYGENPISYAQVQDAVCDSSRYNLFELVDTCLLQQKKQALRMLAGLENEGTECILVLWALVRECRVLAEISGKMATGIPFAAAIAGLNIWQNRKALIQQSLQHHTYKNLLTLLQKAQTIDQIIKGVQPGHAWVALREWVLLFCNVDFV